MGCVCGSSRRLKNLELTQYRDDIKGGIYFFLTIYGYYKKSAYMPTRAGMKEGESRGNETKREQYLPDIDQRDTLWMFVRSCVRAH